MRSEKDAGDGHEHDSDVERASISPTEVVTLLAQFNCHCATLRVACLLDGDGFRQGSLCVMRIHHFFLSFLPSLEIPFGRWMLVKDESECWQ